MSKPYSEALQLYATEAAQRYGVAEDTAFIDAYQEVHNRHASEANKEALILSCHRLQTGYPGQFTPNGYPGNSIHWLEWFTEHQETVAPPPEFGSEITIGVFSAVALSRNAYAKGNADELLQATHIERGQEAVESATLLGLQGKEQKRRIGKNTYQYDRSEVLEKLSLDILADPDLLAIKVFAQARLPDAPMQELETAVRLNFDDEAQAVSQLDPRHSGVDIVRQMLKRLGLAAVPKYITQYYETQFGYDTDLPNVARIRGTGSTNLHNFRESFARAKNLLHVITDATPLTTLPENIPSDIKRLS